MGSVGSVAVESSSNLVLRPPIAADVFLVVLGLRLKFPFLLFSLFKAMEKEQRRPPGSKTAPVAMKASSANATPQGMKNRSQSRRDRKIALQQDVLISVVLPGVLTVRPSHCIFAEDMHPFQFRVAGGQAEEEAAARGERPQSSGAGVHEAAGRSASPPPFPAVSSQCPSLLFDQFHRATQPIIRYSFEAIPF